MSRRWSIEHYNILIIEVKAMFIACLLFYSMEYGHKQEAS